MFPAPKAATSTTKTISTTNAVTANPDIVVEESRREEARDAAGIGRVWHEGITCIYGQKLISWRWRDGWLDAQI